MLSACVCVLSHNNLEVTAYQVCLNTCFEFILIHLNRQFTTLLSVLILGFKSDTLLKYLLIQHRGVAILLISKVTGWSVIFQRSEQVCTWNALEVHNVPSVGRCSISIFGTMHWTYFYTHLGIFTLFTKCLHFIYFHCFWILLYFFVWLLLCIEIFWLLRYRQFEMFMVFPTTNHLLFLSIDIVVARVQKVCKIM